MNFALHELLGVKLIHPQMDGLIKWFNQILKNIIWKFVHKDILDWDKWLKPNYL